MQVAERRVCFVAPLAWPVLARDARIPVAGGAEVQQSILARLLGARGHRVSMVTLDFGQPDGSRVDGVTVHKAFAPGAGLPGLRLLHPKITSMWRALARAGADIYYVRSASIWLRLVTAFCRRHGKRSIYAGASDKDFEPGVGGQLRYARDRWLYRQGMAQVDAIVAQNDFQRDSCRQTYGREPVVIPSCYELPHGRSTSEADLVLWVGMLHANKRPELFIDLARRMPQRRFVMIGGPRPGFETYGEGVRAQAATVPNLEFKGFLPLDQVEPWFDRARVLVNTSTYEGMPNTFLQAWARGVPVAATVRAGVSLGITEVERLCVDDAYWQARSTESRQWFEREHSAAAVAAHYERVFEEICT